MKSIYDMMGKYTYPTMQDDAPREHVESFFQVRIISLDMDISGLILYFFAFKGKKKPFSDVFLKTRDRTLKSIWKCAVVIFFDLFLLSENGQE